MKCFIKNNSFKNGAEINNNKCVQFRDLKSFKLHPHASTAPSAGIREAVSPLRRHLHTHYAMCIMNTLLPKHLFTTATRSERVHTAQYLLQLK